MTFYQKIYRIEREAKQELMNPVQRHQLRSQKTRRLIDEFETWLKEKAPTTLPQSPLGKAFQYTTKRLDGLRLFLECLSRQPQNNESAMK